MKKNFKRTLAKVMAVALTVALAGTAAPEADAAKKIKLSNKSITVTKGKTKKVTIKNVKAKKVKKLTVKSSKKKVATVKKSGKTAIKVTGKNAGSAKITVNVTVKGQKKATKLTLNVKVKNPVAPKVTAAPTAAPTASVAPTATASVAPTASTKPKETADPVKPSKPGEPEKPGEPSAPVELKTTDIANVQLGGKSASDVTYFQCKDNVTDVILNESAKYGGVYTYFDVVVPNLDDLQSIKFDFEAVSGDVGFKNIYLLAGSTGEDSLDKFPDEFKYEWGNVNDFTNVDNVAVDKASISYDGACVLKGNEIEIDKDVLEDMDLVDNKVRFSIFVNVDGFDKGGTTNTEYKISNIQVVGKTEMTDGNDAPGATIDKIADVEPAATLTLGVGSIAIGETTSAEVAIGNASLVGDIKSVAWAVTDTSKIEIAADPTDDTKAVVTAKNATVETTEVVAKITTTKGKEATVKKQIKVTAAPLEDLAIVMTDANTISASDNTNNFNVTDGVASISGQTAYDDAIGITVNLPEGVKLSDYAGIQLTLKASGGEAINKWTQAAVNKYNYTDYNGKGSGGALGWQTIIASNYASDNYSDTIAAGTSEDIVLSFANGSGVPEDVPSTFLLMIGVKGMNADKPYEISNVKLIAKLPTE